MPGSSAEDYIKQGFDVAQAGREAYSATPGILPWKDSWINFAMQYAQSMYEFDQNKEMWNLMNEYNTPAAQMQRYKEAGLNPNLIYSQGNPGNVSSFAQYQKPNFQMTTQQEGMNQIRAASDAIGMVSNLCQNIMSIYDSSLDLQLKRNQLDWSDYERANAYNRLSGFGYGRTAQTGQTIPVFDQLNPFSEFFDLATFNAYQKLGKLPDYYKDWYFDIPKRDYTLERKEYQDYYNDHLLPLFKEFQEGKINLQDYEKELQEYEKNAREMIPPELRGILQPVLSWLSPFIKFIFKSSRGSFNHSVK